jgi:hypothetical protein
MPIKIRTTRTEPTMGAQMILHIKEHHLERAKQVLAANVQAGRFPSTGFSTFIGPNSTGAPLSERKPGKAIAAPKGTTRRDLWSIQAKFLPFPGRIYFENPTSANLMEAVQMFLSIFNEKAPKGGNGGPKKGFEAKYSKSLIAVVNGKQATASSIGAALSVPSTTGKGSLVEFMNIAPHAAALEVKKRIMYDAAKAVAAKYAPGITITYDYIPSDQLGIKYGTGTGGPSQATAQATSRPYPVVYALPRVQIALNAAGQGTSNVRFVTPGRRPRKTRKVKIRSAGRVRNVG